MRPNRSLVLLSSPSASFQSRFTKHSNTNLTSFRTLLFPYGRRVFSSQLELKRTIQNGETFLKEASKAHSVCQNNLVAQLKAETEQVSFYRRPLPPECISFSSKEGKTLFLEALTQGHMESYFRLAENFITQQEPAYCGLAALAMSLNALHIDPKRLWKGPWRWFSEDMLNCCIPIETVKAKGVTFDEFACLAKCSGATVSSFRPSETTFENFRKVVMEVSSSPEKEKVLVATYSRKGLKQTGEGHFSPIGGYHPERNLVLIMDVARFKYGAHWVPLENLWEAMKPIDPATQAPRGFFVMEKSSNPEQERFK